MDPQKYLYLARGLALKDGLGPPTKNHRAMMLTCEGASRAAFGRPPNAIRTLKEMLARECLPGRPSAARQMRRTFRETFTRERVFKGGLRPPAKYNKDSQRNTCARTRVSSRAAFGRPPNALRTLKEMLACERDLQGGLRPPAKCHENSQDNI